MKCSTEFLCQISNEFAKEPNYVHPLSLENQEQKKALVQWFVRLSEVPYSKRTLLGRDPHPKEIFFYQGPSCENEVDAESILRAVQVSVPPDTRLYGFMTLFL